jgi:hypothetical protein
LFFLFVRLECLIASGDETCEAGDLDLIQHMNVDMLKLTRLLNGKRVFVYLLNEYSFIFNRGSSKMAIT